ncbi:MarR family winged helix-turn-helix transcriptional regulator [Streptomyces sp. NPDC020801]|uniref:MarR family winged helix-turn-helix transcriptional regulator n=1 Tax=unclassified Streptomyces TaxID=2593676 RepID=UPI003793CC3B
MNAPAQEGQDVNDQQEQAGCGCGGTEEAGSPEPGPRRAPHPCRVTAPGAQRAVVADILRAASAVRQHVESSVLRGPELNWTAFLVLWVVWTWGESETRHIAEEARISKGTLTGISRTLERRGLLTRSVHPCDRRLVLLGLTEEGEALMRRVFPEFDQEETFVTARLSDEECRSVAQGLRRIVRQVEDRGGQGRLAPGDGAAPVTRHGGRRPEN